MGYANLQLIYRTNFALMYYHKYSLTEIEEMLPFERDLYVIFTSQAMLEKEKNQAQAAPSLGPM